MLPPDLKRLDTHGIPEDKSEIRLFGVVRNESLRMPYFLDYYRRMGVMRFFIVDSAHRGAGLGEQLMRTALDFCRSAGHQRVFLTTFAGLDAARKLYERHGFVLTEERSDRTWGLEVTEQRFDLHMTH